MIKSLTFQHRNMDRAALATIVILVFSSSISGCFGLFGGDSPTNPDASECTEFEYSGGIASWTFMLYISDSDLEYFSIDDIVETETVGSNENVNILVQIDRWDGSDAPDQDDDSNGDWETAKRFYITKDCEGDINDHEIHSQPLDDLGEINTGDPDELISFVEWGMENYPAENYALDIWDHGAGVSGVAYEQSCPEFCYEYGNEPDKLTLPEIDYALDTITDGGENKLSIVGFDACLMATIEVVGVVYKYADIMIASEILEPGDGWDYRFLNLLADDPDVTAVELGQEIVDSFVKQGDPGLNGISQSYQLTMLDMSKAQFALDSFRELIYLASTTSISSDLDTIRSDAVHVEPGDSSSAVDLIALLNALAETTESDEVREAANEAVMAVEGMIISAKFVDGEACLLGVCLSSDIETEGMTGLSVLFPYSETEWVSKSRDVEDELEDSGWDDLLEDYYEYLESEQILFFLNDSLIYDPADFDEDGSNASISLAFEIESLYDNVIGNLTLDIFNTRGYWIDGVEYEFEINSTEIVYLDLWDVTYTHTEEDGPAELLRIEAVLSIVLEDGTHVIQDWAETPPEYLTHYKW